MKIIECGRKLGMLEMLKKKLNTGENGERAVCGMLQSNEVENWECVRYQHNNPIQEKAENAWDIKLTYQSKTGENWHCARNKRNNQMREKTENERSTDVTIKYETKLRINEMLTQQLNEGENWECTGY